MSQPTPPPAEHEPPLDGATLPDDRRADPPLPGSAWVAEHAPPATEAERQVQDTIRSVSRLEESN
jgi:hypothetical protein